MEPTAECQCCMDRHPEWDLIRCDAHGYVCDACWYPADGECLWCLDDEMEAARRMEREGEAVEDMRLSVEASLMLSEMVHGG